MRRFFELLKHFDWPLFAAVFILAMLGLVLIYSTTTAELVRFSPEFGKQLIAFSIGLVLIFALSFLDYSVFKNFAYWLYGFLILLLTLVLIFGRQIRGTKGWFDLGFFQFQPAELGKFVLLIILAKYFASVAGKTSRMQFVVVSGVLVFIPFVLVLIQPDLGSALVYLALWLGLLFFSGLKRSHSLIIILSGLIIAWFSWTFILRAYQKGRIISFINPNADPLKTGYNLIQSKIAIGSGGIFGRGLGHGSQSQLRFLPEQHTDFIFAVLTEELGFVGGFLLLFLFFLVLARIIKIGRNSRDEFGIMAAIGAVFIFVFELFVNIGMNLGILPVVGVPLPFVSYGGSAIIISLAVVGLIESIMLRGRKVEETETL